MIIITDGDATDEDNGSVREAEERGIIRYIIGVGNNFNSPDTRLYLSQFASRPSAEFVKVLDSFEKLRGLFRELQAKIYDIEGTSDLNRFHLELCSSGMSVQVVHGRRVTGAVGADNWAGGLVELEVDKENETFVASPTLEENVTDTYLGTWGDHGDLILETKLTTVTLTLVTTVTSIPTGYAVAGLHVPGRALVAAGAPRHHHIGAVVLFEVPEDTGSWRVLQTFSGEQVGSYFGATLCALDQDGVTVTLLVGAPTYFDGRRGGRVHLYRWQKDALELAGELWGSPGHPLGRFGASLAALGDLNGDNFPEVAVGAPMEDDDRGAIYIFLGQPGGLENHYSQRLEGQVVAPGLRFFGQAMDGVKDLTGDGLVDLAVGLDGHVVVLRSRPVLSVTPEVTFDPAQIPTRAVDCSDVTGTRVTLRLCVATRLDTPSYTGDLTTPLQFRLELDPQRARGRGDFGDGQRGRGGQLPAGEGRSCKDEQLSIPPCLEDFITPIRVSIAISLPHGDPQGPILRPDTPPTWTEVTVELMFDILQNSSWGENVGLTATVSSDNEPPGTLRDNSVSWNVSVRFALSLVATWQDDSTPYLNFSSRRPEDKMLQHRYRLDTLLPLPHGSPQPELTVYVLVPHTLPHKVEVPAPKVQMLRPFRCPTAPLPHGVTVTLSATLSPPRDIQGFTEVELLHEVDPLPVYVGGGVGGLLLLLLIILGLSKCGFFRRNYRERLDQEGEGREGEGQEGEGEDPPSGETAGEGETPP
ncbi:integrin alpha-L-like [Grus japonensis]|uniref:Integrin alpha-L-like n=1 Tax=Grus japonensis TaxID=30415 RepID=A0ABC9Y0R6_GRUJA